MRFHCSNIRMGHSDDIAPITHLLNEAYRGESAKQGWTHEADLIGGLVRTNTTEISDLIEKAGSDFLVYEQDGEIIGCVNLQQLDGRIYLGMLSVAPHLQARGTGKALLKAAEEYTIARGINKIYMSVISDRDELIDFYCRRGYRDTGERKFFEEDGRSGPHLKPLYFSYLEKAL